jgi:hypothetical protein
MENVRVLVEERTVASLAPVAASHGGHDFVVIQRNFDSLSFPAQWWMVGLVAVRFRYAASD